MSASAAESGAITRGRVLSASLVGIAALSIYVLTLAPTVASNDAARFQIAAPLLGTGHPTGYPTFILLGKIFTLLPIGDDAYRVNLMAAVFGALGVSLTYLVCRRLRAGRGASAGAALIFAFSSTFWSQATVGEVYSLHVFFVSFAMLMLLGWRTNGSTASLVAAGLACGLALGNNAGMVLFAPMFLVMLLTGKARLSPASLVSGAVAFLVGLSVYAYVPIRGFAGAWHSYGDPVDDWSDALNLVTGARFQGLMDPSPATIVGNFGGFAADFVSQAPAPFGYALAALILTGGLAGIIIIYLRDISLGVAFTLGVITTLLYALSYEINDIAVYYIPVYLLLCIPLAVAASQVGRAVALAPMIFCAVLLGANFAQSDRSDYYGERESSEAILAEVSPDAVIYGKIRILPVTYLKEVEGERRDVTLRWLDGGTLERDFADDIASGRPVYFISDERDDETYLPATEAYATHEADDEAGLISFESRER